MLKMCLAVCVFYIIIWLVGIAVIKLNDFFHNKNVSRYIKELLVILLMIAAFYVMGIKGF